MKYRPLIKRSPLFATACISTMLLWGSAEAQITGEIIALAQEETNSAFIDSCKVIIAMDNQSDQNVSISLPYLLGLKEGSGSDYTYVENDTFGLSKAYEFPQLAPGERREDGESMLGVTCEDIEQMAVKVNCIIPNTSNPPSCNHHVTFREGVIPHMLASDSQGHGPDSTHSTDETAADSAVSVGTLHANWGLFFAEDELPAIRFALMQDEGGAAFGDFTTTDYLCRLAGEDPATGSVVCALTGVSGAIIHGSSRGDKATVIFNPTDDARAKMIVQWSLATQTGTLRAQSNDYAVPISMKKIDE